MKATSLEAEGGGRCLQSTRSVSATVHQDDFKVSEHTWNDAARKAPGRTSRLNMVDETKWKQRVAKVRKIEEFPCEARS